MFNIYKLFNKQKAEVETITQATLKERIEEIHESFFTEVDRLLAEAQLKLIKWIIKQNFTQRDLEK